MAGDAMSEDARQRRRDRIMAMKEQRMAKIVGKLSESLDRSEEDVIERMPEGIKQVMPADLADDVASIKEVVENPQQQFLRDSDDSFNARQNELASPRLANFFPIMTAIIFSLFLVRHVDESCLVQISKANSYAIPDCLFAGLPRAIALRVFILGELLYGSLVYMAGTRSIILMEIPRKVVQDFCLFLLVFITSIVLLSHMQ